MNVLIAHPDDSAWRNLPGEIATSICAGDVESLNAAMHDGIEVLVTDAMPTKIDNCGGLRWVQLFSSGAEQLVNHPLLSRHPILFTNAAGICAVHIAEFVIAQVLRHYKELDQLRDLQKVRQWGDRPALARRSLRELRAVIIGYGGVGREVARLLRAFGVKITAVTSDGARRSYDGYLIEPAIGDPEGTIPDEYVAAAALAKVLPRADVVVLCASLNSSTRHLFDAKIFPLMMPSAILINVARGPLVEIPALLDALDRGKLAHAYLDVFDEEPLSADSPLWAHPKISLSPHMAGVMPDHLPKLRRLFLANLARYQTGRPLINQLDPQRFVEPSVDQ